MKLRPSGTRVLQIGILFLLVVSAAQVLWWYIDQEVYTAAVSERLLEHYEQDVEAAELMLRSGHSRSAVAASYPHLRIEPGAVTLAPEALQSIRDERARRLNQYLWEGGFFLVVLLACMVVLWKALHEEASLRRRQQNFVAAVSHEFKSPLASLQLTAETMHLRELSAERTKELVLRQLDDLRRMEDMVSKVLDAARLDHGRLQLKPEPVCLAKTVAVVLEEVAERASGSGVRLESHISMDLEIMADVLAASTVVRNLVDNAINATAAAGGGHVSLSADRTDGYVRLQVKDNGLGFRRQEAGKLFTKFYRPGDELRRGGSGTGLGLFIVEGFMQLEKGRVQAHSDGPGKGAVFTVSWPVARKR